MTTHYVGDTCPGGHPELIPPPWAPQPVDLDGLVADLVATLHGRRDDPREERWAFRAAAASDLLHKAGYHTDAMTQTDWRTCPVCSQHPERHAGGAS